MITPLIPPGGFYKTFFTYEVDVYFCILNSAHSLTESILNTYSISKGRIPRWKMILHYDYQKKRAYFLQNRKKKKKKACFRRCYCKLNCNSDIFNSITGSQRKSPPTTILAQVSGTQLVCVIGKFCHCTGNQGVVTLRQKVPGL